MVEQQTEVLVAGAGPVGLLTACLLADAGVQTRIVDRESRTTTRSYACALHPRTLKLLERLGLADALLGQGKKVRKVGFYDGKDRKAELDLTRLGGDYPFLLIVPQGNLESALERRLAEKHKISVEWNTRFDDLHPTVDGVNVTLEELGGTSTGYIVPHWETVVQKRYEVGARFLVGTDGHNSLVRNRLGLDYKKVRGPENFAAYEFESDSPAEEEVRVVLDDNTTNVLWPLPGNKHRWTFQLVKDEALPGFPEKERRAVRIQDAVIDETVRQYVQKITAHRAPWFKANITEVTWCTDVTFEHRTVNSFGRERCWVAGDAAHQTGPVGAQSMNVGALEAQTLAEALRQVLRAGTSTAVLDTYSQTWQAEWAALLSIKGGLKARKDTNEWVRKRLVRILPCLPASGEGVRTLAGQLGLDFEA